MRPVKKYNERRSIIPFIFLFSLLMNTGIACENQDSIATHSTFYINSETGNDLNDGKSPASAWRSLEKASARRYVAGEKLLLSEGCTFHETLILDASGSEKSPVIVSSYPSTNGKNTRPIIDAKGWTAAIQIENGKNLEISNLELTSDSGTPKEATAKTKRYGVSVVANLPGSYSNIVLKNLYIHHIFATENVPDEGQNPTSNKGMGIFVAMEQADAKIDNIKIENCQIEMTGHTGIRIFGFGDQIHSSYLYNVSILNNQLRNIGGPGMVPGRCENLLVRGNITDHTGSSADPRMHARGSGIWPWTCNQVLIEKNKFMHARGKNDSCGAHIDFNCNDVVVQYNLSMDNEGGFVEILGNDHNCAYRYNISINDGFREKGVNGADKDGHILWTSGYTGNKQKRTGPFNSYIYNNTIFVKEGSRSTFSFAPTSNGIFIANNIFYIQGTTVNVSEPTSQPIQNVVFTNNLYLSNSILPEDLSIQDNKPIVGSPGFKNAGGVNAEDYIPGNTSLIKNKGIKTALLPGDTKGLWTGLDVKKDYFGNPIIDLPDLGAIELNQ